MAGAPSFSQGGDRRFAGLDALAVRRGRGDGPEPGGVAAAALGIRPEVQSVFGLEHRPGGGAPGVGGGRAPNVMPGGQPVIWVVGNPLVYLVLFGAFALAGLFLGALYFGGIAQQVRDARLDLRKLVRSVWGDWLRLIALVAIWLFLLAFFGIPMALLAGLLALISPVVGSLFSLLGSMLGLWALIYMGFALHGIILQRRGLFGALWDSIRLVHRNLAQTAGLS